MTATAIAVAIVIAVGGILEASGAARGPATG